MKHKRVNIKNIVTLVNLAVFFVLTWCIPQVAQMASRTRFDIILVALIGIQIVSYRYGKGQRFSIKGIGEGLGILAIALPVTATIILTVATIIINVTSGYNAIGIHFFVILYMIVYASILIERIAFIMLSNESKHTFALVGVIIFALIYALSLGIYPLAQNPQIDFFYKAVLLLLYI